MIATLALTLVTLAAPPIGELVWWRPTEPATGLAVRDGGVMRGLGPGRTEWWPLDGDPPRLLARTTPCPAVLETFDPPLARLPDRRTPWGPITAHAWSDAGCALTATVAGPLVQYRRDAVARVVPRSQPARLVATDPACRRGAVVDDDSLRIFALDAEHARDAVSIPFDQPPTDVRLTDEAAILAGLDGALELYHPDGRRLAAVDLGAPMGCAATAAGLLVAETADGATRAYAMSDGGLRWGRAAVDAELGDVWSADPPSVMSAMAVGPDGRWIAVVTEGRARLWSPATGVIRPIAGAATDVAFAPDGRRLAVRGPDRVTIWRVDGPSPTRGRRIAAPDLPGEDRAGPTLAWLPGDRLVALTEAGLTPLMGIGGAPLAIEEPRAVVPAGEALLVLGRRRITAVRVGRSLTAGRSRPAWPLSDAQGTRLDCDGALVTGARRGWRPVARDGAGDDQPAPVRICPPAASGVELRMTAEEVLASTVERRPGQPPIPREVRVPLLGAVQAIHLDETGRVTALLDGRAVVRWRPGGGIDRATWVVVGGRDVLAVGDRITGAAVARGSLAWWTPGGLTSAAERPASPAPLRLPDGPGQP